MTKEEFLAEIPEKCRSCMNVMVDIANYEINYETHNVLRKTSHEMGYDYPEGDLARAAIIARTLGCAGIMTGIVSNGEKTALVSICGSDKSAIEPENQDIIFENARVKRDCTSE